MSDSLPAEPDESSGTSTTGSTLAAGLTAICTVLVAVSAFLSAQAASDSDDQYAISSQQLDDANFFYEQGAGVLYDELRRSDYHASRFCVLELVFFGEDGDCASLTAAEFDVALEQLQNNEILEFADELQDDADELLESGLDNSARAVDYQAALVLFAVGLALSAWASLSDTASRARMIFVVLALASLGMGAVQLASV